MRWERVKESIQEFFRYAPKVIVFILLWVIIGLGIFQILFFMPDSWGDHNDYDEFVSYKSTISLFASVIITGFVFHRHYSLKNKREEAKHLEDNWHFCRKLLDKEREKNRKLLSKPKSFKN